MKRIAGLLLSLLIVSPAWVTAATRVTVEPLEHFLIAPERSAPARVVSRNDARLSAEMPARIDAITARVGDRVKKGDTLVRLDCRDAKLAHQSAEARLALARKNARRARSLQQSSSIAEQNYNQALTEEIQADVQERQTALQVQRCRVTAPFSGVVTARLAAVGELASAGSPLLSLLDTNDVEVSASVPESELPTLQAADSLVFRFEGQDHPLTLRAVIPRLDPASASREIRLEFQASKALPGSHGRLHWRLSQRRLAPALLSQRNGQTGLFIARDGKAVFHPLPSAAIGHPAPIDLPADTPVIVDGRFGLKDGDPIEIRQ